MAPQIWIAIVAIITGPTSALLIGKYLEERRAKKNRKIQIFRSLMANRASRLSAAWVEALNGIETEFYGQTKVIEAWRVVIDQLYSDDANDPKKSDQWLATLTDSMNDMLYEMAESLDYHFDRVTIKRNAYNPKLWGEIELEQHAIRKKFLEVLDGKRRLPVAVFEEKFPDLIDDSKNVPPVK
jgi:hypothetical protein